MSTFSEKRFFSPFFTQLASNGHHLTVVSNVAEKSQNHPNITEIIPISVDSIYGSLSEFSTGKTHFWEWIFMDMSQWMGQIEEIYKHPDFQVVLSTKYDLIFTNLFFGQAFYGLIHRNSAPFILLQSYPVPNYFLKDWGMYSPCSHVPYPLLEYTDEMNFAERVVNFVVDWAVYFHVEWNHLQLYEEMYRKYDFGEGDLPGLKEIQKNASLMMMNTHYLSTFHRPLMPDVVEVGCLHCRKAGAMPKVRKKCRNSM
jgi:glucuronosyltransferase